MTRPALPLSIWPLLVLVLLLAAGAVRYRDPGSAVGALVFTVVLWGEAVIWDQGGDR